MCIHSVLPPWNMLPWLFLMGQKLSLSCYTLVKEKTSRHTIHRISCESQNKHVFSLLEKVLLLDANFFFSCVCWRNKCFDHGNPYKITNPLQGVWVYGGKITQELAERTTRCRWSWSRNIGDRCSSWPSGGVHTRQHLHHAVWHLLLWRSERLHDDFYNCVTLPEKVKCCSTSACKHLLCSTTDWQGGHKERESSLEKTGTRRLCRWLVKLGSYPPYKHLFHWAVDPK